MKYSRTRLPAGFSVSFSPDGSMLACGGTRVHVIDTASLERISLFKPFPNIWDIAFSSNGKMLIAKNSGGVIAITDSQSGKTISHLVPKKDNSGCGPCFVDDDRLFVDGSWDGTLRYLSVEDGKVVAQENFYNEMISGISHDRRRTKLLVEHSPKVTSDHDPPANGYLVVTQLPLGSMNSKCLQFEYDVNASQISNDGTKICFLKTFLSGKGDSLRIASKAVQVVSVDGGKVKATSKKILHWGYHLAWSPDDQLIVAAQRQSFDLYEATTLDLMGTIETQYPSSISFHPDGESVALGTRNTTRIVKLADFLRR